jgi:ADP-ribosylglycohydrolase
MTPAKPLTRRRFIRNASSAVAAITGLTTTSSAARSDSPSAPSRGPALDDRVRGLLLGSLIGDALGGPIEFQDPERVAQLSNPPKRWREKEILDEAARRDAIARLHLRSYRDLRPVPEPFGQWPVNALAGTITDDSRHKMVLLEGLDMALRQNQWPFDNQSLAQAYLDWPTAGPVRQQSELNALRQEWLAEWHLASRWCRGERDLTRALPPERIWNGLPTCCGQMTMLPLAGLFPGNPERAYRAAYALGLFDNGWGKDLNAAVVAGLAQALSVPASLPAAEAWESIFDAMRRTDPFRYGKVPWVTRSVDRWLDLALDAARESDGQPARLFARLEAEFRDTIKWEAQVPFVVTFAVLALSEFDPLAALQLSLEWGHDTDSYAQLVGAFIGARHGTALFPVSLSAPVLERLRADYAVELDDWVQLLAKLRFQSSTRPLFPQTPEF